MPGIFKINAVGDIALFKSLQDRFEAEGISPFSAVGSVLNDCDLLVGNFEFPFSAKAEPGVAEAFEGYRVRPASVSMLGGIRFDILSLANNHCFDWGLEGISTTREILHRYGAKTLGAGPNHEQARKGITIERAGLQLGFLAYCKGGPWSAGANKAGAALLQREAILDDIARLKSQVDHVILFLHWGIEFCDYPYPSDVDLGRSCVDAGASVIFGSHSHVIQGVEEYRNSLIYYGLGNFIYEPRGERIFVDAKLKERAECMVAQVSLNHSGVSEFGFIPCRIGNDGCTRVLEGEAAEALRNRVQLISEHIGDSSLVYSTAAGNLLSRELQTYWLFFSTGWVEVYSAGN